nr:hypothetical protein [Kibdelosporangium sp. MJ126-NF4]
MRASAASFARQGVAGAAGRLPRAEHESGVRSCRRGAQFTVARRRALLGEALVIVTTRIPSARPVVPVRKPVSAATGKPLERKWPSAGELLER